jgi:hypothetical protein
LVGCVGSPNPTLCEVVCTIAYFFCRAQKFLKKAQAPIEADFEVRDA